MVEMPGLAVSSASGAGEPRGELVVGEAHVLLAGVEVHDPGASVVDVNDQRLIVGRRAGIARGGRVLGHGRVGRRGRHAGEHPGGDSGRADSGRAAQHPAPGRARGRRFPPGFCYFAFRHSFPLPFRRWMRRTHGAGVILVKVLAVVDSGLRAEQFRCRTYQPPLDDTRETCSDLPRLLNEIS